MGNFKLPYYTGRDYTVMFAAMMPYMLVMNCLIFGLRYFSNWGIFLSSSVITIVCGSMQFIVCGFIAVEMKQRFPNDNQLFKRLFVMILVFIVLSALFISLLFWLYDAISFFDYTFN